MCVKFPQPQFTEGSASGHGMGYGPHACQRGTRCRPSALGEQGWPGGRTLGAEGGSRAEQRLPDQLATGDFWQDLRSRIQGRGRRKM